MASRNACFARARMEDFYIHNEGVGAGSKIDLLPKINKTSTNWPKSKM